MTEASTDWTLKLHAFLHDPFEKPLILFSERHTVRAEELTAFLGLAAPTPSMRGTIRKADHYASAMNRLVVEDSQTRHPVDFVQYPLVVHPLSGETLDLEAMGGALAVLDEQGLDRVVQGAKATVETVLQEIMRRHGHDHQRLFLALWRLLPERLRQEAAQSERLGALWTLLPADSRVPDHSIWDHLSSTSAMATALDTPAFLLFTLGPVQEFIATARRTQDLWVGSFLLSYLTWQGMRVIAERLGPDCVLFPSLFAQPLVDQWLHRVHQVIERSPEAELLAQASFPNRFLALVPASQASTLGEEARQAVLAEWRQLTQHVKRRIEDHLSDLSLATDNTWNHLWRAHGDACFETYWVALPWGDDPQKIIQQYKHWLGITEETSFERVIERFRQRRAAYINPGTLYPWLYDLTERALGGRKALRTYNAAAEEGYKCSLCGIREALRPAGAQSYSGIGVFWASVASAFSGDFHAEGRERLCAVCVTKRLAVDAYLRQEIGIPDASFPSTSTMAVETFRAEVLEKPDVLQVELEDLVDAFREVKLRFESGRARPVPKVQSLARQKDLAPLVQMDGRWFFQDGYEPAVLQAEYAKDFKADEMAKTAAEKAREKLQKLLNHAEDHKVAPPSTYYAIVYMDGDRMGEWLSGEHKGVPTIQQVLHPRVREALRDKWQEIMEEPRPLAPSLHTAVSSALRAFSQEVVRPIVEAHCGMLVYAGGDDVIAFFPLRHVLPAIWDLRRLYSGDACECEGFRSRRGFVQQGQALWMMMGQAATASVGIAIAHHLQPLSQALDAAREAEHVAKRVFDRNAFAVNLLKRSGERLLTGAKFTYGADVASIEILQGIISALRSREEATLSSRLMYQLAQEGTLGLLEANAVAAQEAELKRLISRHVESKDENKAAREAMIQQLTTDLTVLLRAMHQAHQNLDKAEDSRIRTPFQLFTSLLLLTRFIAMGEPG
jgi:CRISPR-associated protein Cmr2